MRVMVELRHELDINVDIEMFESILAQQLERMERAMDEAERAMFGNVTPAAKRQCAKRRSRCLSFQLLNSFAPKYPSKLAENFLVCHTACSRRLVGARRTGYHRNSCFSCLGYCFYWL